MTMTDQKISPVSDTATDEAISLLEQLIGTSSRSGEEAETAGLIFDFLSGHGIEAHRHHYNVWARNRYADPGKPNLLLNSHHDTVRASAAWTRNPLHPENSDGRLYGLGSNDAGAALVSLISVFRYFYERMDLPYNLILAATAEEENSGPNGLNSLIQVIDPIAVAVVGEPTGMDLAVAEKGLMVLRCRAEGKSGHAAHNNHDNAIIKACRDINWFSTYRFRKISNILGPVKMTVTMINAGEQHNVVPDRCDFTVDIRTNELYSHEDILETIKEAIQSGIVSSSLRLRPSHISDAHPLVRAARKIGLQTYGSATLSDQAVLDCPSVKIGPGQTERSHTADEYVYLDEIREGIRIYRELLETFFTL